jgi:mRNA-degrading endonuclease toxin of MazEF toxin-antitoxin module
VVRLSYGDIVIVTDLLDRSGRNPKDRPAVVVTPTDELEAGRPVFVIAITTSLPDSLPEDFISLPRFRPRHPRTGLDKRNAAVCRWLAKVDVSRIARKIGRVPTPQLSEIACCLRAIDEETD